MEFENAVEWVGAYHQKRRMRVCLESDRPSWRAKIRESLQRKFVAIQILGKSVEELRELAASWKEPAYRGDQIYHALYAERIFDFERMTTLFAKLRERLAAEAEIRLPRI